MLSKEDFVRRILDGASPTPKKASKAASSPATFSGDDVFSDDTAPASIPPPADTRFAQLLLEEVFGHGEALDRDEVVLGEQKTSRLLPNGGRYWPKTNDRPFHIVLFELDKKGREVLADGLFSRNDLLEDALHRIIQDVLDGFEKPKRAASTRQGAQSETLCVVSLVDDRNSTSGRQLVCFGTKSTETKALEVFTLREEVRDWDRPLAEEHLDQLFERHFKKLAGGAKWQEAFITGDERKKIKALLEACAKPSLFGNNEEELRKKLRDVLDEIAGSFGIWKKSANQGRRLDMVELPVNHGIGADPEESQEPGFKNPLQGVRIYDRDNRLLGFVVYVASTKAKVEPLREALATNNHFHNVLVIYPDSAEPELELWQGGTPLRGRLTRGARRTVFDGEGGIVQLLSRFFVVSKSAIEKPKQLATELAWRAQHLKALAVEELEKEIAAGNDKGPLKKLFDTFNAALATLNVKKFASAYAETITYGMLAARWLSSGDDSKPLFARKNLKDLLPETSAFLKDLFDKLVNSNFDKNLSWLLDDITSLLARTSVAQVFQDEKHDPSIHFYEDFLDAYDPQVRKDQGVYYTPDEVVSYIVRTAHASLQSDFGLPLGLADTTTWAAFAKAKELSVPEGVDLKAPFVQVLDPALGTGTFLLRVIEVIHETMQAEFKKQGLAEEAARKAWVSYVRKDLLPRINGFELMMAPYIVSHLRLGLALQETGFKFQKGDALKVLLTNSLEPASSAQNSLLPEFVSKEAARASEIKGKVSVTVVLMNPPYSRHSSNVGDWITGLASDYKRGFPELNKPAQGKALADDYVKFIRLAQYYIERSGAGCVCFISNHGFISNPTFRGFRKRLLETFSTIDVLDLDGNTRRRDLASAELDENVFNIQQGVAIATLVLRPNCAGECAAVRSAHLRSSREKKFSSLSNGAVKLQPLSSPAAPNYMFSIEVGELDEWQSFTPLPILMGRYGDPAPGFVTTHDEFAISWSAEEALHKVSSLLGTKSEADARRLFQLCTTDQWSYADAVTALSHDKSWKKAATRVLYRPFDWRYTIWNEHVNVHRRERAQAHLLRGDNLALVTVRQVTKGDFAHALVSDAPTELKLASHDRNSQAFPLWLYDDHGHRVPNFSPDAAAKLGVALGTDGDAIDLFHVIYAVLHSPQYRTRYSTHLRAEFPSVPPLQNAALRRELARVGADLVATHLLRVDYPQASWTSDGGVLAPWKAASGRVGGTGDTVVGAGFPKHSGTKLMLNAARWVDGVSNEVWNFGIGGYPVLRKWLKSRAGRKLSPAEVELLSALVGALTHTIVLMQQVDEVVGRFGGWPSAFCATLSHPRVAVPALSEDDDE